MKGPVEIHHRKTQSIRHDEITATYRIGKISQQSPSIRRNREPHLWATMIQKPLYDSESMWETEDGPRVCVDHVCSAVHFVCGFHVGNDPCQLHSRLEFCAESRSVILRGTENDICGSSGIFWTEYSFSDILYHADSRSAVSFLIRNTSAGPGSCVIGDLHSDQDC